MGRLPTVPAGPGGPTCRQARPRAETSWQCLVEEEPHEQRPRAGRRPARPLSSELLEGAVHRAQLLPPRPLPASLRPQPRAPVAAGLQRPGRHHGRDRRRNAVSTSPWTVAPSRWAPASPSTGAAAADLPEHKSGPLADLLATAQTCPGVGTPGPRRPPVMMVFVACGTGGRVAGGRRLVTVAGTALYVVTISRQQVPYGQADVLGRLCDEACVGPTDSPYVVDGIALSVLPMGPLALPDPGDGDPTAYLRSRRPLAGSPGSAGPALPAVPCWAGVDSAARRGGAGPTTGSRSVCRSRCWAGSFRRDAAGHLDGPPGADGGACPVVLVRPASTPPVAGLPGAGAAVPGPAGRLRPGRGSAAARAGHHRPRGHQRLVDESWSCRPHRHDAGRDRRLRGRRADVGRTPRAGALQAAADGDRPTPRALPDLLVDIDPPGTCPSRRRRGSVCAASSATWFGGAVDLRVCARRPGPDRWGARHARHMDRISLLPQAGPGRREPVDVLVPERIRPRRPRSATSASRSASGCRSLRGPPRRGARPPSGRSSCSRESPGSAWPCATMRARGRRHCTGHAEARPGEDQGARRGQTGPGGDRGALLPERLRHRRPLGRPAPRGRRAGGTVHGDRPGARERGPLRPRRAAASEPRVPVAGQLTCSPSGPTSRPPSTTEWTALGSGSEAVVRRRGRGGPVVAPRRRAKAVLRPRSCWSERCRSSPAWALTHPPDAPTSARPCGSPGPPAAGRSRSSPRDDADRWHARVDWGGSNT